jgi:hypothetical protein
MAIVPPSGLIKPQGPVLFMALTYELFGLAGKPYFILSYVFRVFGAIGVFLFTLGMSRNRLAAAVASAYFATIHAGIEATDWVFNMNVYLGIAFGGAFLYFYSMCLRKNKLADYFLALVFFASAVVTATYQRMYGVYVFVLMDLFWIGREFGIKRILTAAFRELPFFVVTYLVVPPTLGVAGFENVQASVHVQRALQSRELALALLSSGKLDFVFYPFAILGQISLPVYVDGPQASEFFRFVYGHLTSNPELTLLAFAAASLAFLSGFSVLIGQGKRKEKVVACLACVATWSTAISIWLFLGLFWGRNLGPALGSPLGALKALLAVLVGIWLLFLSVTAYVFRKADQPLLAETALVSIAWTLVSFFFPWLSGYLQYIFGGSTRYLIVSAAGFSVFVGSISALVVYHPQRQSRNSIRKVRPLRVRNRLSGNVRCRVLLSILLLVIAGNTIANNSYFEEKISYRSEEISNSVWNAINRRVQSFYGAVLYVTYDPDATTTIYSQVVAFDFEWRIWVTHRIWFVGPSRPTLIDRFEDLLSIARTDPSVVDRTYAFHLVGSNVIDRTDQVRNQLLEALSS